MGTTEPLRRQPLGHAEVPEGVEVVPADADSSDFTERAAKRVAVVYQCLNTPYDKWPDLSPRVQDAAVDIP
jgi:hypothetical protein